MHASPEFKNVGIVANYKIGCVIFFFFFLVVPLISQPLARCYPKTPAMFRQCWSHFEKQSKIVNEC